MLSKQKTRANFLLASSTASLPYKTCASFMADLVRFRGSMTNMTPCLNGQTLDLFALYNEVTGRGGSKKTENAEASNLSLQVLQNHLRDRWNLSTDLVEPVEYRSLILALTSGLPNEVDYAMNTILLMSSHSPGLELNQCPQLVSLLLSSVGVVSSDPDSYSTLWKFWKAQCHRSFEHFWNTTICGEYQRQFLDPTSFAGKCTFL
ncbi:unnamed protein product [Dibothriocephalus latus]|uniref:ARID domain-containing protein n=1 Tax=Dibothriocephalus latus TaxID=60516 RepID=A0A3P7PDP9_DIBLA|nr:unnamed protein product [Dibothriocephalus latus]